MKFPPWLKVYGDINFRGVCPKENAEQVTFFARLRRHHADTWGRLALHPRNEGQRSWSQTAWQKAEGMTPGASDIIVPGAPSFVCEMKRKDHTKCSWEEGQAEYLKAAQDAGAFVCVALGCDAAWEAFHDWLASQ
jgi:hypothetical protein